MNDYKISVHISYFNPNKEIKKINKLKKVCFEYLKISKRVDIFVHTINQNKDIKNSRIQFICHNIINEHPYKLTWKSRSLMFKQRNNYDYFICGEEDIVFSKKNFNYWLKFKDICLRNKYNLGFLRVEKRSKDNKLYCSDQIKRIKYYVKINNYTFAKLENPNCSIWIYDKKEFKKFIKTKYWNFNFKLKTISGVLLIREMSAIGWNADYMNRYKGTIIPFQNKKLFKESFIHHISNNYANNPAGLFGTIKVEKIFEEKLNYFFPKNNLLKLYDLIKYYIYFILRFNLKKIKKDIINFF